MRRPIEYIEGNQLSFEQFPLLKMSEQEHLEYIIDVGYDYNYFVFLEDHADKNSLIVKCPQQSFDEKYLILLHQYDNKYCIRNREGYVYDLVSFTKRIEDELKATPYKQSNILPLNLHNSSEDGEGVEGGGLEDIFSQLYLGSTFQELSPTYSQSDFLIMPGSPEVSQINLLDSQIN